MKIPDCAKNAVSIGQILNIMLVNDVLAFKIMSILKAWITSAHWVLLLVDIIRKNRYNVHEVRSTCFLAAKQKRDKKVPGSRIGEVELTLLMGA